MNKKHIRTATLEKREDSKELEISGYFAVFNSETELFQGAFESLDPACFNSSLDKDVRALINHDTSLVLGRTTAGTLKLEVDDKGLLGTIKINENDTDAMNIYERVKRNDVNQCSFGFFINDEETEFREDGTTHWTIKDVELFEVSVCTFPAYEDTGVQARHKEVEQMEARKNEAWKHALKERLKNGTKSIDVE